VNRHPQHALVGPRLTLRPLEERDLPALLEWLREPDVLYWWDNELPDVAAAREEFLHAPGARERSYVIEEAERGVGLIQCHHPDQGLEYERYAGIDIFIGVAAARERGLGTEAVRMLLAYLFEELGVHRVTIDPEVGNARAIRAYEKAGFRFEGVLRGNDFLRGGYIDTHFMAILEGEWPAAKARWERERAPR
jgi:RimJ/RimL family protein N-acetyltransferase